jgi:putative membrane protein insertion efficiency factor
VSKLAIYLVLLYRAALRPLMPSGCRFHPTCSQYAIDAINKHGALRGMYHAIKRVMRCHPWGGRGYDPA